MGGGRRSWSDEKSSLSLRREYQNKGQPVKMVEAATSQNGCGSHKQIVMETSALIAAVEVLTSQPF